MSHTRAILGSVDPYGGPIFPEGPDRVPLWDSGSAAVQYMALSPNSIMALYLDPLGMMGGSFHSPFLLY